MRLPRPAGLSTDRPIMNDERNPYAPPQSNVELVATPVAEAPPLWNPNAAAIWSLFFTPAFGAFLHMKNWQALGEPQKAAASRAWAVGSLVFLFLWAASGIWIEDSKVLDGLGRIVGFALLLSWYYASGKPQIGYVLARFGKTYPRRGWAKPILIALGVIVVFVALIFAIAFGAAMFD